MRAKFLLMPTISVLGLGALLLASPSFAQDDVYVDFSVLDSLGENNSPVINDGPLFPIVKSATRPAAKIKPAKKALVKKASPRSKSPKIEKVKIPAKNEVKVEVKFQEPEATPAKDLSSDLKDSPFAISTEVPVNDAVSSAPVAPIEVKIEELPTPKAPVISAPINGNTPLPKTLENPIVMNDQLSDALPAAIVAPVVEQPENTIPVEMPAKVSANVSADILFVAESSDLSSDNKVQIDQIIAGFEDPHLNKIAIYAFNVDNGKDVFRKKRMSLNRAIEVRSYLLGKGYKNFSIKVINIDEESNKQNLVTIEELK